MKRDFKCKGKQAMRALLPVVLLCAALFGTGCSADDVLRMNFGQESREIAAQEDVHLGSEDTQPQEADAEEEQFEESTDTSEQLGPDAARETTDAVSVFLWEDAAGVSHFAYDSLSDAEKIWYRDMELAIGGMQEEIRLSEECFEAGLDETDIDDIFQCVLNDHPELFFVEGYTYTKYTRGSTLLTISFSGAYSMSREEALEKKQEIEAAAETVLEGISADAPEYDKVKYVYETLICQTDYDLNAPENQNIYSVFVNKTSVCQGYAKAAQYLLNRLGLECTLVMGTVDTGESHAWNLVKVDGSYYYLDATWGDASYRQDAPGGPEETYMPEINYDYLCVTTADLLRTHTLGGVVPMPECVAVDANYYVREGALFQTYDKEQMKQLFDSGFSRGRTDITVKCADVSVFQEIVEALIEQQEIFEYLANGSKTIAYAHNEKQLTLTFWVTNG